MSRRLAVPFSCLLLLAAVAFQPAPASADERVPMISSGELPTVGTVAPIERQDVTHVRVGKRDDIRWFAVTGVNGIVDYQTAVTMLQAISTTATPPLARVPWIEPGIIMKILDAGAMGVTG